MSRLSVFALFAIIVINISCERCMRCRYSYTTTEIIETPGGEEEKVTTFTDQILLNEDGESYGDECLKREEYKEIENNKFAIEHYYELEAQTTTLDDFEYVCAEP